MHSTGYPAPRVAEAKPPAANGFMRADELQKMLAQRLAELKAKEEFDAKPRAEKLAILLDRGQKKFGKETLTGAGVVEEVFAWDALSKATLSESAQRTVKLLPKALHSCYGDYRSLSRTQRRDRQKASKELVTGLLSKHRHVRTLSIECLYALYGERRGYRPDAPEAERKRIQKSWAKAIRR